MAHRFFNQAIGLFEISYHESYKIDLTSQRNKKHEIIIFDSLNFFLFHGFSSQIKE